jgi:hypothetical protein
MKRRGTGSPSFVPIAEELAQVAHDHEWDQVES